MVENERFLNLVWNVLFGFWFFINLNIFLRGHLQILYHFVLKVHQFFSSDGFQLVILFFSDLYGFSYLFTDLFLKTGTLIRGRIHNRRNKVAIKIDEGLELRLGLWDSRWKPNRIEVTHKLTYLRNVLHYLLN